MSRAGDERLARRARRGDERAFAAIFERYHQRLYRYCLGILANPEDAQDALQNTMVKALRALPGEERSINLKPWLYRIAHNESIDLLRRRRTTEPIEPDSLPERPAVGERAQIGVVERVEIRERLGRLLSDLQELPDRQRGALLMRELSDLSFEEIAASFDTSPGVARQTVYEARLSLRQMEEGREMSCDEVMRAVSDGDRRVLRRKDIQAHLRTCERCAGFEAEIADRHEDLAALAPVPALAAAGILGGVLGGGGGGAAAAGGAAAGGLGSGAAATLASSAALKAAATVAVVAALGTAAADRGGLIQIGRGGGDAAPSSSSGPAGTGGSSNETGSGAGQGEPGHAANGEPGAHPRGSHAGAGRPAKPGKQASEPAAPGSSPRGKATGHGKSPSSSEGSGGSHGAKKNGSHGSGGTKAHPEHSSKPPHPTHPEQAQPPKPAQPTHPASPGVSSPSEANPPAERGGTGAGRAQGQGATGK